MWEVLSFGDKPYGEMSNQEVNLDYLPMASLIHPVSSKIPVISYEFFFSTPIFGTISCVPFFVASLLP